MPEVEISCSERRIVRVGLYGVNGHQVQDQLVGHSRAELRSVAMIPKEALPSALQDDVTIQEFESLDSMLAAGGLDLVVLCSPRRSDQAEDAIRCLKAGCSVLAEKPCALNELDLDRVLEAAKETQCEFWEMAELPVSPQLEQIRLELAKGSIGEVVQVLVQKCYPWADWRPTDEQIDGGLACQVGVYGARFAEHVLGLDIAELRLRESTLCFSRDGSESPRAVEFSMEFTNGAIGTTICNYSNPIGSKSWGYDLFRVFGTEGILEYCSADQSLRLLNDEQMLDIAFPEKKKELFDCLVSRLLDGSAMPTSLERALNPTRLVLRAKQH